MKRLLTSVFALTLVVGMSAGAFAKDGLSVDLGLGYQPDWSGTASAVYSGGADVYNNGPTVPAGATVTLFQDGDDAASLQGMLFGFNVRYDFLNAMFARVGFEYGMGLLGGEISGKFTVQTANDSTFKQTIEYSRLSIPVIIGINVPIAEKYNVYTGAGLKYSMGTRVDTTESVANLPAGFGGKTTTTTEETYEKSGFAFTWSIGADAQIANNLSLFLEYTIDSSAGTVAGESKTTSKNSVGTTTATVKKASAMDNGGDYYKVGVKYFIF